MTPDQDQLCDPANLMDCTHGANAVELMPECPNCGGEVTVYHGGCWEWGGYCGGCGMDFTLKAKYRTKAPPPEIKGGGSSPPGIYLDVLRSKIDIVVPEFPPVTFTLPDAWRQMIEEGRELQSLEPTPGTADLWTARWGPAHRIRE